VTSQNSDGDIAEGLPPEASVVLGQERTETAIPDERREVTMEEQTGLMCETEPGDQAAERPLPAPRTDSSATLLALIEQLALDPGADVAKLERIIVMYERLDAREAELAYNAAKGRILKKLAGIRIVKNRAVLSQIDNGKPQKGTYEAFKYAPLEEIDKHLRPLLAAEEMDLSYSAISVVVSIN